MTATGLLTCRDLSLTRSGRQIFQNFNLVLAAGEAVHVTGANGAGKTSFLRACANALQPQQGTITIDEHGAVFFLPADDRVLTGLRCVADFLNLWARLWEVDNSNIDGALVQAGLAGMSDRALGHLSAGQKRRLHWARLFLQQHARHPARLWLLDEPFKGLDKNGIDMCTSPLTQHLSHGGAVLIASQEALPPIAHRVVPLPTGGGS